MDDLKQPLRMYFTTQDDAISSALNTNEALIESLRVLLPGFSEEFSRQSKSLAELRAEQASGKDAGSPSRSDQLIHSLEQRFGRRQ